VAPASLLDLGRSIVRYRHTAGGHV
jgi:hypothetical protein